MERVEDDDCVLVVPVSVVVPVVVVIRRVVVRRVNSDDDVCSSESEVGTALIRRVRARTRLRTRVEKAVRPLLLLLPVVVVVVKASGCDEYAAVERRERKVSTEVVRSCMIDCYCVVLLLLCCYEWSCGVVGLCFRLTITSSMRHVSSGDGIDQGQNNLGIVKTLLSVVIL